MPLITLEYSDNLKNSVDYHALFNELHQLAHQVADVNVHNCKSKAQAVDCYYVGTGGQEKAYVHLDFCFIEGRSPETKKLLGDAILKLLQRYYQKSIEQLNVQITVKIEDIKRELLFKYNLA
jgi:5-carboxymethyl-2-hydroxymuconate isomerase